MSTEIVSVSDMGQKTVVEDGEAFAGQILSYMKYAGGIKAVESLLEKVDEYSQNNKAKEPKKSDVTYITDKNSNELQEMVKNINLKLTKIKNIKMLKKKFETASQKLEKASGNEGNNKNAKAFLGAYRRLLAELDKKAGAVSDAIILIKQYEGKKVQFLKESGYTSDVRDYIDENLKSLEKAEDTINQIKKLGVSDFSIIDLKNTDIAKFSIKTIEEVQACLESLTIGSSTEKDKENQSIYENAKAFLTSGILSLVLQDVSDISDSAVSDTNLPTNLMTGQMENSIFEDIKNKAVLSVYADIKFGNFLKCDKDFGLRYELEYIVNGHNSDRENLKSVAEKITGIRNAMNLAYIVTDSKKMAEISTVASSAAAAIGLPFFEPIIKGVLVEAWAFAEAVNDVRELYKGNKIPFVKTAGNWQTSLKNIGRETENGYTVKKGMDYVTYLQILMLLSDEKIVPTGLWI